MIGRGQSLLLMLLRLKLGVLLTLAGTAEVSGQATAATISGRIQDATGAVLPGVTVRATNLDTGIARTTLSDPEGRYSLLNLSLGKYEVRAELPGFREEVRTGVVLTVGRHAVVDLVLQVGELTEQFVVTGEAPLVESTHARVGGFVDDRKIRDLPLNARSFTDLALFQTGVKLSRVTPKGDMTSASYGTMMTVSGARPENNVYKLDGTDVSDVYQRGTGAVTQTALGVEAIREFAVLTHNYGADQGKVSGGVVNVVTRSGTNQLQGTVFAFHRNDNLDARNFFDRLAKPEFKRNQFGFAIGGPIVKDRTFVFGTYEGLRERLGLTKIERVPTAAAREGRLQDPRTRQFTPVQIKPAVLPYLNLYPLPTPGGRDFFDGTADFITTAKESGDQDYFAIRFDDQLKKTDSLFVRYTFNDGLVPRALAPWAGLFGTNTFNRNQYATIEDTHIFSPRLLNTFRFGYSRSRIGQFNVVLDPAGNNPSLSIVPGRLMPALSPGGVSSIGPLDSIPRIYTKNLFDGTYEVSYSAGVHSLKAGVQLQREQVNAFEETRQNSRWSFPGLRDFLEGTNVTRMEVAPPEAANSHRALRQWYSAFFIQDDLRAMPSLTLNLGLRAEHTTNMTERYKKMSSLPETRFRDGSNADLRIDQDWYENPGVHWAPRFGFAWDPTSKGKAVLRGGAGLHYDHIMPWWQLIGAWRNFPYYNVIAADRLPDGRRIPFPLPVRQIIDIFGANSKQIWQFQLKPEKITSLHFSLNWQQQLAADLVVKVGYVGSRATHLGSISSFNQAQPIGTTAGGSPFFGPPPHARPNPNYEIIDAMTTGSDSFYHGMELEVNKRLSRGFQFQGSYTLSKMHDTKAGVRTAGDPEGSLRRDFVALLVRGLSPFDVRHNFTLNFTYELPSPSSSAIARHVGGGWQVNGLVTLASGHPFTVTQRAGSGDLKQINRPDLAPGRDMGRDVILGGADRYFDPTAFLFSDPARFGNVGRNTLIGPGLATVDLSLNKQFRLPQVSERFTIQFRSEFFNLLNHANFRQPSTAVFDAQGRSDTGAGRITSTSITARQVQFGLKILF